MGQRIYTTYFDNVSISAIQDVFSIKAGAANGVELHQIDLSAGGVNAAAEIRLTLRRISVSMNQGSGGSVPTITVSDSGDTKTATAVVHANDTAASTSSGTIYTLAAWQWQVLNQWTYLPAPEDREVIQAGEGLALYMPAAPGANTAVSGTIKWRELP
jgi:hypothetical protein